jgi:hypothetical protein
MFKQAYYFFDREVFSKLPYGTTTKTSKLFERAEMVIGEDGKILKGGVGLIGWLAPEALGILRKSYRGQIVLTAAPL